MGCYSLSLDGLAQEAGALFRPLVEALELLAYFNLEPARVEEALTDRLPSAGGRAKKIGGHFQDIREHLNQSSSHMSFNHHAVRHVIDFSANQLRLVQPFNENVLRTNLNVLGAVLTMVAVEVCHSVFIAEQRVDNSLADRIEDLKRRALTISDPLVPPSVPNSTQ